MLTRVCQKTYVLDGCLDRPCKGAILKGMRSGISHKPPSTIPSGPDVGISANIVNQCSATFGVALFSPPFVSEITQKVMDGFSQNRGTCTIWTEE